MKIGCVLYSDVVIGDQYPMTINNIYSVNLIHSHFTIKTIKLSYLWFVSTNSQVGKVKIYWFKCFVHNYTQTLAQVSPNLTKNFFHLNDFDRLDLCRSKFRLLMFQYTCLTVNVGYIHYYHYRTSQFLFFYLLFIYFALLLLSSIFSYLSIRI